MLACASLLPFLVLFLYSCKVNGLELPSYAISVFTNFCLLPGDVSAHLPGVLPTIRFEQFVRWFRFCILATAAYGIFLFFLHPLTGNYLEIPYLTVNAADYGLIELTKHIARGRFLKLISTYNNGNVYGAAILIVLPLYDLLEPARWKRNLLRLALVLTLSRTIWAGLVIEQMLSLAAQLPAEPGDLSGGSAGLGCPPRGGRSGDARSDRGRPAVHVQCSGAGDRPQLWRTRAGELSGTLTATWLPTVPVTGFPEVLYSGAAINYGIAGLVRGDAGSLSPRWG